MEEFDKVMEEILQLEKKYLNKIEKVEDYYQIYIETAVINVYNPMEIYDLNENVILKKEWHKINKRRILKIYYNESSFMKIELDNQNIIFISLLDDDYSSPEAIEVNFNSGKIIVI